MYRADFHFSTEDVYANRFGKLTPQQEELVESIYRTRQRGAKQTIVTFSVLFFVLLVMGIGVEFNQREGTVAAFIDQMLPIFGMVVAGFTGLLIIAGLATVLFSWDVRQRRISTVEGKASVYVGEGYARGTYTRYELTLKKGLFRTGFFRFASETAVRQFEDGKVYRVYYIQFYPLPIVLSAEEV